MLTKDFYKFINSIFSTSYPRKEMVDTIFSICKIVNPFLAVELGSQQGRSSVIIASAMKSNSTLYCFDAFLPKFPLPPYAETHSDKDLLIQNINKARSLNFLKCNIEVEAKKAEEVAVLFQNKRIDFLHIDIGNHYDNIKIVLPQFLPLVNNCILLDGGVYSRWMRNPNFPFKPYKDLLNNFPEWKNRTIVWDDNYAITFMYKGALLDSIT